MNSYLDILEDVLENGIEKKPTRKESGVVTQVEDETISLWCREFRHNMADGFPLVTTKKMPIRTIAVELEGFIKGITDKTWYQERKCKIWNEWASLRGSNAWLHNMANNPEDNKEGLDGAGLMKKWKLENTDLGPFYGYQWRHFGKQYGKETTEYISEGGYWKIHRNGLQDGTDQLAEIVSKLHKSPYDRRMVCIAWNPNQNNLMALPPCHYSFTVGVYQNTLNLKWNQRSCDMFLGVPFNIASYAILLKLLAKEGGFEEGELVGSLEDCHIYKHHIPECKEQLSREPYSLSNLTIPDETWNGIFKWDHTQLKLTDYECHPKIEARVTI